MSEQLNNLYSLAKLETFSPDAFKSDDIVPQDVCNFVLALSLVFNDLRDLIQLHNAIVSQKPEGEFKINRKWGTYNGIWLHSLRLGISLVHEVLNLVNKNSKVLEHTFFKSVLKQIPREARDQWSDIVQASQGKQVDTPFGKFALFIRNKISFHYDPKEIFKGYSQFFSSQNDASASAFVSRGSSMSKTRFYFADAAVRGYFTKEDEIHDVEQIITKIVDLMDNLNFSLMSIIHHFIQKRGFGYKIATEET